MELSRNRKRAGLLLLLIALLSLSGCGRIWAEMHPIRELRIVGTVGCDLAPEGAALSVCAAKPELKLRQEAPSLRIAMDRLCEPAASQALFFAHTQFFLAGRALAESDLAPLLDLSARSADLRLGVPLFLLRNGEAADVVLAGADGRDATDMLTALRSDITRQGVSHAFSCGEILLALAERGAALAAACAWEDGCLRPDGYGVLQDGRCVGWIPEPADRAADLLLGLGGHGDVRLSGATLTLAESRAEIRPVWNGNALAGAEIRLRLRAELTETDGRADGTTEAGQKALERALAQTAQDWTISFLRQLQMLKADAIGLGGTLEADDPARWARMQGDWEAIFPALPIAVSVTAELDRTQDLQAPVPVSGGAE